MESEARPISDRWELTERIGSGAMGEVWRGRHRVLGHAVAVKMMKRDASRDQSMVARFLREARIAAQLRHRNIARVEDFGTSIEGKPFLVMELLTGSSLEDLIERGERLSRARVLQVARHVGAACDVAHAEGVIHRDLKPANCFVVRDEDAAELVKVLDFGVAKVSDGLLSTRHAQGGFSLIGTPVYMSPEQARGDEVIDGRSDLWSLGVMVYELLTGELPFQGDSLPMLLVAIQSQPFAPPSAHDPTLSASVDAWTARALARDPAQRFRTGREMADALGIALAGSLDPHAVAPRYAPTAPMERVSLPPPAPSYPPNTLAPTQPMRAVHHAPSYPDPLAAPPSYPEPALAPRDRRPLVAVSALLLVGAAVFAIALLRREGDPATADQARAARPVPVTEVPAAQRPTPVPAPVPAPVVRPARTVPSPAPAPVPPPRASAPAARAPRPTPHAHELTPGDPPPIALPPQPQPQSHAPYNPEQP